MSIRRLWPVAVVPLFVLGAAAAPASFAQPPEVNCAAVGPNISHPTGTSTKVTFAVHCDGAATVNVKLEIKDGVGATFASVSSTSDLSGNGTSANEVLLPIFAPKVCLTVGNHTACTP